MHVTREACMDGPHDGGEEYGAVYCISSSRVGSCCTSVGGCGAAARAARAGQGSKGTLKSKAVTTLVYVYKHLEHLECGLQPLSPGRFTMKLG